MPYWRAKGSLESRPLTTSSRYLRQIGLSVASGGTHCCPAFFLARCIMRKFSPWLWIGGVVGVLAMGMLRFVGKNTDIFGLLAGMTVVIAILAFFVIRYVNRKW